MKNLLLVCFVISTLSAVSQNGQFKDIEITTGNIELKAYTSSEGVVYQVGDEITIGLCSRGETFSFITIAGLATVEPAAKSISGHVVTIKSIRIWGGKRNRAVWLKTTGNSGLVNLGINLEKALMAGEVVSTAYTSDMALSDLKKAKDKLDLGLITQSKYDSLKAELSKFIK